jgi:predicted dehydrogenase
MMKLGNADVLGVVVVGCGIRGQLFATALSQNPRVTVVAVVDADVARAERLGEQVGARAFPNVSEMLAVQLDAQAAIIATPDFAHLEPAVQCAEHGLHLMVEKPLTTDTESARKIVEATTAAGNRLMVAFENRWNPRFIEAMKLVDSGELGTVSNIIAQLNDTIFVPTQMLPWAEQSSPAWFLMPHTLDLALWFTRSMPVQVYAKGTRGVLDARGVATWDAITAIFTLADGQTVTLHSSWVLPESKPAVFELRYELQGSKASLSIDGATHGMTLFKNDRSSWPQLGVHWWRDEIRGVPVDMVNDFVRYVLDEDIDVPTGHAGVIVTTAIEALHQSLASEAPVPITDLAASWASALNQS